MRRVVMRHPASVVVVLLAVAALLPGATARKAWAQKHNKGNKAPFDAASIYIEFNSTDQVQASRSPSMRKLGRASGSPVRTGEAFSRSAARGASRSSG